MIQVDDTVVKKQAEPLYDPNILQTEDQNKLRLKKSLQIIFIINDWWRVEVID